MNQATISTPRIKTNDFVTLNVDVQQFNKIVPAGTQCRVCKVPRNSNKLYVYPLSGYNSIEIAKDKVTPIPKPKFNVQVGDIFVSSGGYEQTNCQFYKVVGLTKSTAKVVTIRSKRKYTGPMCGEALPVVDDLSGQTKTVRLQHTSTNDCCFKAIWGSAYKWTGQPEFFSEWH